jgi:hypothetical protein
VSGRTKVESNLAYLREEDLMSITFEIDPSLSFIKDENIYLANYLKDKFLSIDVYDADTRFQFASCKLPLFELLRQ